MCDWSIHRLIAERERLERLLAEEQRQREAAAKSAKPKPEPEVQPVGQPDAVPV